MFPQSFNARVPERMAIWCAMLGFLLFLYATTEFIQLSQRADFADRRQQATAAMLAHIEKTPSGVSASHAAAGKELVQAIAALNGQEAYLAQGHRQNKLLIVLLMLFVAGQVLVLEYRWLVRPVVRIAAALKAGNHESSALSDYARRRDEIGVFAQAISEHFALIERQRDLARAEQDTLAGRLSNQDELRRASLTFQTSIAGIVRQLEDHSGRMSEASANLASVSMEAGTRAGASVQSTERVSGHVDVVASSIRDIAETLTSTAEQAERTSTVAASARQAVDAACEDARDLTLAARTIEQVIALIEDVAEQTNLLALNATIEAARAGEMGRGFGVVAQEVKQLATRTSRATEDVRSGLQGITAVSVRITERVGNLVETIEQVAAVSATIAQSMREQDDNSRAITSNTARTAADVRDVAAAVKDVAGMIGEAKGAADLVTKVSADLGRQASELRAAVERFVETTERTAA
jgi:methyl-accepting chemotaxis protein